MKTKKQLINQANTIIKHLSEERDKLRQVLYDLQEIESNMDDGIVELECAVDTLSQYL
jgi:hypothetical protein